MLLDEHSCLTRLWVYLYLVHIYCLKLLDYLEEALMLISQLSCIKIEVEKYNILYVE